MEGACNLVEECRLEPDEVKKLMCDIFKGGSTTIAEGFRKLLQKVRISPDRRSSDFFRAACQRGLDICSKLDRAKKEVSINPKQCAFLTEYMRQMAEYLTEWQTLEHPHIWACNTAMIDLVRCVMNGLSLLDSCGKRNWKRRALLGEITRELSCIIEDLDALLQFILSILDRTRNKQNTFVSSEALKALQDEDLKHLKERVVKKYKRWSESLRFLPAAYVEPSDNLLGPLNEKYEKQSLPINRNDISLNKYIGQGAYGTVHEVVWMGQVLAQKTLEVEQSKVSNLMEVEQTVLSKVSHPNIVKMIGYCDNTILMELLHTDLKREGCPSSERVTRCLSVVKAVDIMHQVAKAMSYLHHKDIVHRDLKPANILLNPSLRHSSLYSFWSAKLADFGIAKHQFDTNRTKTGMRGTLIYMAPEMRTDVHYTRKVDVYSFGATFMAILGADMNAISSHQENQNLEKRDRVTMDALDKCCPFYLKSLLRMCLDPDPKLRPHFPEICNALSFCKHQLILYGDANRMNTMIDPPFQLLLMVHPAFPSLPYLTNTHGPLKKLFSLIQTTYRLHFMCEWQGGAHCIRLEDRKSFKMTLRRESRIRQIRNPILRLYIDLVAPMLILEALLPDEPRYPANNILPDKLIGFASDMEVELQTNGYSTPDPTLLHDFLERILPRHLGLEEFGLFRVHTPSGIMYLCDQHSKGKGYTRAENQHLLIEVTN